MPAATPTYVPIPHFRVVDRVAHAHGYYGHQVTDQHFGITPDDMRFFGVLCLKSDYTGYTDMVGLRKLARSQVSGRPELRVQDVRVHMRLRYELIEVFSLDEVRSYLVGAEDSRESVKKEAEEDDAL